MENSKLLTEAERLFNSVYSVLTTAYPDQAAPNGERKSGVVYDGRVDRRDLYEEARAVINRVSLETAEGAAGVRREILEAIAGLNLRGIISEL